MNRSNFLGRTSFARKLRYFVQARYSCTQRGTQLRDCCVQQRPIGWAAIGCKDSKRKIFQNFMGTLINQLKIFAPTTCSRASSTIQSPQEPHPAFHFCHFFPFWHQLRTATSDLDLISPSREVPPHLSSPSVLPIRPTKHAHSRLCLLLHGHGPPPDHDVLQNRRMSGRSPTPRPRAHGRRSAP